MGRRAYDSSEALKEKNLPSVVASRRAGFWLESLPAKKPVLAAFGHRKISARDPPDYIWHVFAAEGRRPAKCCKAGLAAATRPEISFG